MKIQVTSVFCKALKDELKKHEGTNISKAFFESMPENYYKAYVDYDIFRHEDDYNYASGEYKVLRIVYDDTCYACDRFITTQDLASAFKHSDKTYEGFFGTLISEIAI